MYMDMGCLTFGRHTKISPVAVHVGRYLVVHIRMTENDESLMLE